jgi:hypothetical protein
MYVYMCIYMCVLKDNIIKFHTRKDDCKISYEQLE